MRMALVHDLGEAITGDIIPRDGIARGNVAGSVRTNRLIVT